MTKARQHATAVLTPRLLTAEEAALYTGRGLSTFLEEVKDGEWSPPIPDVRRLKRWDIEDLDADIERRKGKISVATDRAALDREMGL